MPVLAVFGTFSALEWYLRSISGSMHVLFTTFITLQYEAANPCSFSIPLSYEVYSNLSIFYKANSLACFLIKLTGTESKLTFCAWECTLPWAHTLSMGFSSRCEG